MNVTQIQDAITKVIEGRKQKSEAVDGLDAENSQLIDEINCLNKGVDELLDAISQEEFRADKGTANVQTQVFEHCKSFKQALCALLAKCGCDNGGGQALLGSKEEDDGRREIIVKRVIEELKGRWRRLVTFQPCNFSTLQLSSPLPHSSSRDAGHRDPSTTSRSPASPPRSRRGCSAPACTGAACPARGRPARNWSP